VRSVLYRFPDLDEFERVARAAAVEAEIGLPPGEVVDDGEWVLAIFELGPGRRATSAAGRGVSSPEGARLLFEPRDLQRLTEFAARQSDVRHEAGEPPRTPRVLIVDDDPDIRDVLSVMLESVGLSASAVESAEEALERVAHETFDLLLLDWNLPRMTGLELCRTIRESPRLAALPVLFLTANASSQDMVEAFASGCDDYVVKPFRAPELGARIFSLLRRARKPLMQ
jgi:two-component system phosphate regulon response regulator PhoB